MLPQCDCPHLLLLVGIPGSGKTTLACYLERTFARELPVVVISYDAIETELTQDKSWDRSVWHDVRKIVYDKCVAFLENYQSKKSILILDDNMYYRSMRYLYFKLARKADAQFAEIFLDCPLDVALERNSRRSHDKVSEATIRKMAQIIEIPDPSKYSWEEHSMQADSCRDVVQFDLTQLLQIMSLKIVKLPIDNSLAQESQRASNCRNLTHQVDLATRKEVSTVVADLKRNTNKGSELIAAVVNLRKEFMKELNPDSVIDADDLRIEIEFYSQLFRDKCAELLFLEQAV